MAVLTRFPGARVGILWRADTDQICADAVRILRHCGLNAAVADTGGGTVCIMVSGADTSLDETRFTFGTAGETWATLQDSGPSQQGRRSVRGAVAPG